MVTVTSLSIFPFAARPMFMTVMGFDARRFSEFMEAQRCEVPRIALAWLKA